MERTTLKNVESWIAQVTIDRSRAWVGVPAFMRPYHFAILASEIHRSGAQQFAVPRSLQGYAARMHLWQCIGLEPPTKINEREPSGRFHPLTAIASEASAVDLSDAICEVFRACGTSDEETLDAIGIALAEIFGNCVFHSESESGIVGLACAQSWPAARLAQVAVADSGIGIRRSLTANPLVRGRLERENANELATELGITSKPDGDHSGYGLTVARQLMEKHGGNFLLLSANEGFRATAHRSVARKLRFRWAGTIVILEWNMDVALDIGNVYGSWPSDGESDEFL